MQLDILDENIITKSQEYYYINRNNPKKTFLFATDKYYYIKVTANYAFVLATDGLNDEPHSIIYKVTQDGATIEKIEEMNY